MSANDGGPAFPVRGFDDPNIQMSAEGMTLRDYFAAQVVSGLLACPDRAGPFELFAKESYECADAMLAERAKPK